MACHAAQVARGAVHQQTLPPAFDHLFVTSADSVRLFFGLFHCQRKRVEIKPKPLSQLLHPIDVIGVVIEHLAGNSRDDYAAISID